jgi:hypothetical protein
MICLYLSLFYGSEFNLHTDHSQNFQKLALDPSHLVELAPPKPNAKEQIRWATMAATGRPAG